MSDPTTVRKGGFGAFTARERTRLAALNARALGEEPGAMAPEPLAEPGDEVAAPQVLPHRLRADKTTARPPNARPVEPREPREPRGNR